MTNDDDARVLRTMGELLDAAQIIGLRLRKYRKEVLSLTSVGAAEHMGVPWGTYVRMERGECWIFQHREALERIGFKAEPMKMSEDGFDRLLADLSRHRSRNADLLREGALDLAVFEEAVRATEGINYAES